MLKNWPTFWLLKMTSVLVKLCLRLCDTHLVLEKLSYHVYQMKELRCSEIGEIPYACLCFYRHTLICEWVIVPHALTSETECRWPVFSRRTWRRKPNGRFQAEGLLFNLSRLSVGSRRSAETCPACFTHFEWISTSQTFLAFSAAIFLIAKDLKAPRGINITGRITSSAGRGPCSLFIVLSFIIYCRV